MLKAGDKVRNKETGEVFTVAAYEEPTGNLRLSHHYEHQWHHVKDYELVPEDAPVAEPVAELETQSEPKLPAHDDGDAA
jgi:hypothetical protein